MKNLGEQFINGRIVNLDTTSAKELEEYLDKVRAQKAESKNKLNDLIQKIYM